MTFEEWFHKEYEPADLQIKQYADRNEGLHIPAKVYLEDLKKAFEAGMKADVHTDNSKVIADLEEKLANADYQFEGRDNEIRELEEQIEKIRVIICEYSCLDEKTKHYIEVVLTALQYKPYLVSAEPRGKQLQEKDKKIEELEKENTLLKGRNEGFEKQIMGLLIKYEEFYKRFPDLKSAMDKAAEVLKENAELKRVIDNDVDKKIYVQLANKAQLSDVYKDQLTKAKEIIKELNEGLDKLYLSGLSEKQIAFIEKLQDKAEQTNECHDCAKFDEMPKGPRCRTCDNGSRFQKKEEA